MKLHNALISSALVTAVAAEKSANNLRRLKADKAGKHGAKAVKDAYSYSSYSMSYGPPPTPPTPNPAPRTPSPTPPPTSPSTAPPTTLSPTTFSPTTGTSSPTPKSCCEPESLRDLILTKLYDGDDAEVVFRSSPQKDAIEWLEQDVCDCSRESCLTDDRLVQRYILAVLYYSTNGSSWPACSKPEDIESTDTCQVQSTYGVNIITISDDVKVSEGFRWLTCNTECEWSGANCNNKNELGVIDMEKNIPGGNLPTEVGSLSKLLVLALEQSNLQGVIPTSYEKLTKLQILDFDFNILSGELIDLSRLTKLQQLDLNNNNLSGSIVTKGWQNLTVLQFVDLSYNEFTGQIPVEIGGLTTLQRTIFQCSPFVPPVEWVNCPTISLSANDNVCDGSTCECQGFSQAECDAQELRLGSD